MSEAELHQERTVVVERPAKHYTLLRNPTGDFLGVDDGPGIFAEADDRVIWDETESGYIHVCTGLQLASEQAKDGFSLLRHDGRLLDADANDCEHGALFAAGHGPAELPSNYLNMLQENGWVCLPCILSSEAVDRLEQATCTGAYENDEPSTELPLLKSLAVARASTEPISLWVIRQYMNADIRLAHPPSFAIQSKNDGKRDI